MVFCVYLVQLVLLEEGVDWQSIDMAHHVADVEQLRVHVGIERWIVFGLSWGSVLGLTYAERHPSRVTAVVVAAASTGTAADIDWVTVHAGRSFLSSGTRSVTTSQASSARCAWLTLTAPC